MRPAKTTCSRLHPPGGEMRRLLAGTAISSVAAVRTRRGIGRIVVSPVATVFIERIEWAQVGRGFETKEGRGGDVEGSECGGFGVQNAWIKVGPSSAVQPFNQVLKRGDRLRGSER